MANTFKLHYLHVIAIMFVVVESTDGFRIIIAHNIDIPKV